MDFEFDDLTFVDLISVIKDDNLSIYRFIEYVIEHDYVDIFLRYQRVFLSYIVSRDGGYIHG